MSQIGFRKRFVELNDRQTNFLFWKFVRPCVTQLSIFAKTKISFFGNCVTSRDNHGIRIESESNPNRSNLIRSNSNRSNLIRDSIESNPNLTQFDSIRFVRNTNHDKYNNAAGWLIL